MLFLDLLLIKKMIAKVILVATTIILSTYNTNAAEPRAPQQPQTQMMESDVRAMWVHYNTSDDASQKTIYFARTGNCSKLGELFAINKTLASIQSPKGGGLATEACRYNQPLAACWIRMFKINQYFDGCCCCGH